MLKLNCGHIIDLLADVYVVSVKDVSYCWTSDRIFPVVSFMGICKNCFDEQNSEGMILFTKEEEDAYLRSDVSVP